MMIILFLTVNLFYKFNGLWMKLPTCFIGWLSLSMLFKLNYLKNKMLETKIMDIIHKNNA